MIWVSDLRIRSLGLLCLSFGFAMHSCVGGFGFLVVVGEVWAMVEVVCTFVWIFCGRLLLGLRAVGGFGFLVMVVGFLFFV